MSNNKNNISAALAKEQLNEEEKKKAKKELKRAKERAMRIRAERKNKQKKN